MTTLDTLPAEHIDCVAASTPLGMDSAISTALLRHVISDSSDMRISSGISVVIDATDAWQLPNKRHLATLPDRNTKRYLGVWVKLVAIRHDDEGRLLATYEVVQGDRWETN